LAGKTPYQAVRNFLDPLQRAVSCVYHAVIHHGGREYEVNTGPYALVIGGVRRLKRNPPLTLDIRMQYKIVEASGDRGPYKVKITAYMYIVEDHRGHELFSYHWHPDSPEVKFPHLHVEHPTLKKAHLPTGRISLEEVLRLLITDFGVCPLKSNRDEILTETLGKFSTYRTWG
jgi:hypothetical protein